MNFDKAIGGGSKVDSPRFGITQGRKKLQHNQINRIWSRECLRSITFRPGLLEAGNPPHLSTFPQSEFEIRWQQSSSPASLVPLSLSESHRISVDYGIHLKTLQHSILARNVKSLKNPKKATQLCEECLNSLVTLQEGRSTFLSWTPEIIDEDFVARFLQSVLRWSTTKIFVLQAISNESYSQALFPSPLKNPVFVILFFRHSLAKMATVP